MKPLIVVLFVGTAAVPAFMIQAPGVEIDAPKLVVIGGPGEFGCVRVAVSYRGFGRTPNIDVRSRASGVRFDRMDFVRGGGSGVFHFTIRYSALAPKSFEVEIVAHDGTVGTGGDHYEKEEFEVRRK